MDGPRRHSSRGAPAPQGEVRADFRVAGMDCAEEVSALQRAFAAVPGVAGLDVDLLSCRLSVRFDPGRVDEDTLLAAVQHAGLRGSRWIEEGEDADLAHGAGAAGDARDACGTGAGGGEARGADAGSGAERGRERGAGQAGRSLRDRLALLAGLAVLAGMAAHAASAHALLPALQGVGAPPAALALYALAVLATGVPLLPRALASLRARAPDMHLLMVAAIAGALALGDWLEAATVAVLFALSLQLEAWSVGRARRAVSALLSLSPRTAEVLHDGHGHRVPLSAVAVGARVLVRPGERVPLDGLVADGSSAVDESPLTGEHRPVAKAAGDAVFAGSINGAGALQLSITRVSADSTVARIARMVGEAHRQRGGSERFVERFARVYTPAVMALALVALLAPPLLAGRPWGESAYQALVLLVIACPCALVISTPVSVVCALASAARAGVLVKGGRFIEEPARARCLAFDKTGTLTAGRPVIVDIVPFADHDAAELLALASAIETASSHPLGSAIVAHAAAQGVRPAVAQEVRELPGRGAEGRVHGSLAWIGSHRLLEERGQETPEQHRQLVALEDAGRSVVILGTDAHVCGLFVLADEPRPHAAAAIAELRALGIRRLVMLTGDNAGTALALGARLGLDEVRAGLLPEDKLAVVRELSAASGPVAMVGDGINDTPALAAAHVGIALGGAASDVAIETADVVVMSDDLRRLPWLVRHSRRTLAIIRQNVAVAIGVKLAVIGFAFAGHGSLWAAIAADMGVSLAVVANALRLLRAAPLSAPAGARGAG